MNFEKHAQFGNEYINGLAKEMGVEKDTAGRILRATLKVLRRRVLPEEYLDFVAQLPFCIKAMAVEGWKLSEYPDKSIKQIEDFVNAVMKTDPACEKDFAEVNPGEAVKKVFHYLKEKISEGEAADIENNLPKSIREFFESA